MRDGAPDEVLAGSCEWTPRVQSWLGGVLLAGDIPVVRGRVTAQVTQDVPDRLSITVPAETVVDGHAFSWRPGSDPMHPLGRYGQELQVSIVVRSSASADEWETRVGRFLITDWTDGDDGAIDVSAEGRLRRAKDALLTSPIQPMAGGTLTSEARRLLPAGMSAAFDPALTDRTCPGGMAWSESRLSALQEIADAWPALLRTDEWGQVIFRAPLPEVPTPVVSLTDGERGTVVGLARSDTRDGAFNQVVARSSASGVEDVQAVASQLSGPMAVTSDYGPVTRIWSSPLITNRTQAQRSAQTMLASSLLPATSVPVTCAPDPRIDLDDPVEVWRGGDRLWGWVTGYDLPLTVDDGEMRIDLGVQP